MIWVYKQTASGGTELTTWLQVQDIRYECLAIHVLQWVKTLSQIAHNVHAWTVMCTIYTFHMIDLNLA